MLAAVDAYLTGVRPHRVVGGTIVTSALCIAGEEERKKWLLAALLTLFFASAYRLATTPFEGELVTRVSRTPKVFCWTKTHFPLSDTKAAIFGRLMAVAKVAAGGAITAEAEKMKAKLRHELHKVKGKESFTGLELTLWGAC